MRHLARRGAIAALIVAASCGVSHLVGCAAARAAGAKALPLVCDIVGDLLAQRCPDGEAACIEAESAKMAAALEPVGVEPHIASTPEPAGSALRPAKAPAK